MRQSSVLLFYANLFSIKYLCNTGSIRLIGKLPQKNEFLGLWLLFYNCLGGFSLKNFFFLALLRSLVKRLVPIPRKSCLVSTIGTLVSLPNRKYLFGGWVQERVRVRCLLPTFEQIKTNQYDQCQITNRGTLFYPGRSLVAKSTVFVLVC